MLEKLVNKRYNKASAEERQSFIDEAERMIRVYGWEDRDVMPWEHCKIKVTRIIDDLKGYDTCTNASKEYVLELANGLVDILNAWEAHEHEPKVTVRSVKTGKLLSLTKEFAGMLIAEGSAVAV